MVLDLIFDGYSTVQYVKLCSALEGVGAAASVIAVVELAAKVGALCLEYSSVVKSTRSNTVERRREPAVEAPNMNARPN